MRSFWSRGYVSRELFLKAYIAHQTDSPIKDVATRLCFVFPHLTWVNACNALWVNLHLEGTMLTRVDFARARITGSYWRDAPAVSVGLHRADLRVASFGYADMTPANFSLAQVAAANFRHANLRQASLEGTRSLHDARWGSTATSSVRRWAWGRSRITAGRLGLCCLRRGAR